jgi:hypothetical protein
MLGPDRIIWITSRIIAVPSENVIRVAAFAVTAILLYHEFHANGNFTHTIFNVEVSPRVDLGKLGATSSTQRIPVREYTLVPSENSVRLAVSEVTMILMQLISEKLFILRRITTGPQMAFLR